MNIKLVSLVLVAVLLGASLGGIIAVAQTKVVDGETGGSAEAAPHFAPLNPDFVKYQQGLSADIASAGISGQAAAGFVPPPVDLTQLKGQSIGGALVGAASLPSSYDLRTHGKLTSVRDQGSCGDCWAFAAYASLESYLRPSETRDFSESHMNYNHGFDIAPCAGGNEFMATAYLARWSGPVNEGSNSPVQKHVQDVYFIPDRDNANIKTAVMTYGAVYTQMHMAYPSSYYNAATYAYYDPYTTGLNHAVAIVGWNDNYAASNFAGHKGAWIVKNSWGTGWPSDNGYFYVSYYDANIGRYNAAFTAQPTTKYNNIYQYDPLGATGSFGQGSASEWGANVFTARASANLAAVSFYTLSLNAPYDVYVYIDPTSGPISTSGPIGHVSGVLPLPGYHTIPLTSGIPLRAGQKFSVVVKFTSTSNHYPVPTEGRVSDWSSAATAQAGQSYYRADGSAWKDMTSYPDQANTNICIKAFTTNPRTATQITLTPSTTTPAVNQKVTFIATLKSGTAPLSSKSVTIYHYLNGVRYTDTTKTTNANGQITLTQSFGSAGPRPYYATFAGDASYKASTGWVTINVGGSVQTTTTTLTPSTTTPAVGQSVTFTATLKSGTKLLSGKSVTIYHFLNGVEYTDTTKTTNANGQVTVTQRFGSAGPRPYYATFAGDASYKASTGWVTINVH